jgi:hypothetical protein
MKLMTVIALVIFSVSAFAQNSTVLTGEEVTVMDNPAMLEKTTSTPFNNNLNLRVPKVENVCLRYEMRQVYGQNGAQCGYDRVPRTVCDHYGPGYPGPGYPRYPRPMPPRYPRPVPPRRGPRGPVVRIPAGPRYNPVRHNYHPRCRTVYDRVARSCNYTERFCAESERRVVDTYRKFNLQITKFPGNATIELGIDENENLTLNVLGMAPSCVKKVTYKNAGKFTGAKLSLKRRCR